MASSAIVKKGAKGASIAARRLERGLAPAILTLAIPFVPGPASASGPYSTDDFATTPAGSGQVETWFQLGEGGDFGYVVTPATSLKALPAVEWSAALDIAEVSGARDAGVTFQAKWKLREPGRRTPGFAIAPGVRVSPSGDESWYVYGAATLPAGDRLLVHANAGATAVFGRPVAGIWGIRAEYAARPDKLALHAEIFEDGSKALQYRVGLRPTIARGAIDLELALVGGVGALRARTAVVPGAAVIIGAAFRF
jgi:hypothetical protein